MSRLTEFRTSRFAAPLAHGGFALFAALALMSPMFLTGRTFGPDWINHLWVMNAQAHAISDGGPSLFLHADGLGIFYPHFAFYGGTLYTLGGGLSAALGGHPIVAYLVVWLFGFLMAYGGMLWLSFQAGLTGWQAHVAPLVLLTSASYITNAFARGVLPELIAISAIPLLLAATLSMLRSPKLRLGQCAAFVLAVVIFTGSHNLTLVWGTLAIGALALVGVIAVPALRRVSPSRVLAIGGLGILAIAVNAWFLMPDLVYAHRTAASGPGFGLYVADSDLFDNPGNLFSLLRHTPKGSTTPSLDTQLPVLIGVWVLFVAGMSFRFGMRERTVRIAAGIAAVLVVFMGLLMMNWPWDHLPKALTIIQFTYRLESYVVIALALLVAVMLRATDLWTGPGARFARPLHVALALVVALGFGQAVAQGWATHSFTPERWQSPAPPQTRSEALASPTKLPSTWYAPGDYRDRSAPVLTAPTLALVDPTSVKDDRAKLTVAAPTAKLVTTNIAAGNYLVKVSGLPQAGRDSSGFQVLATPGRGAPPVTVVVQPRNSPAVVIGRWITIAALVALIAAMMFAVYRTRRRRTSG